MFQEKNENVTENSLISHLNNYLPLTGGSLTGRLSICLNTINPSTSAGSSTLEIREVQRLGTDSSLPHTLANSPRLGFHWSDRYWAQMCLYDNAFRFYSTDFSSYYPIATGNITATGTISATGDITTSNGYLKSTKNGNTVTIGSQNTSYCHFTNSANIPFWFNKTIQVDGDLVIYNNGRYSLKRGGISTSWVGGRDGVLVRTTSINGYSPAISIKTTNGSWEIGAYDNSSYQNMLIFSYVTDANYNAGNNTSVTARITPAGAFTNASQRKLKENIKPYTNSALDKINDISICSFNMKDDPSKDYRVGFIADDTDSIFSGPHHEYMDLNNCVGMLLKAVQELSDKVDKLEGKLN